jgi:hypothetical protein
LERSVKAHSCRHTALLVNFCEVRKLFFDCCDGHATPVSIGPRIGE